MRLDLCSLVDILLDDTAKFLTWKTDVQKFSLLAPSIMNLIANRTKLKSSTEGIRHHISSVCICCLCNPHQAAMPIGFVCREPLRLFYQFRPCTLYYDTATTKTILNTTCGIAMIDETMTCDDLERELGWIWYWEYTFVPYFHENWFFQSGAATWWNFSAAFSVAQWTSRQISVLSCKRCYRGCAWNHHLPEKIACADADWEHIIKILGAYRKK